MSRDIEQGIKLETGVLNFFDRFFLPLSFLVEED